MRYAKTGSNRIVDARDLQTSEQRRDWVYLCPECAQRVTFVFSQGKTHHFRHPQKHKVCVLSSMTRQGRMRKSQWKQFIKIQTRLAKSLQKHPDIDQQASMHWETPRISIYLLPYYYPEQRFRTLNQDAKDHDKQLLFLIAQRITATEFTNINRYDCYRMKPRAIHMYAQTYSLPPRLILTDGMVFYKLSNQTQVWSPRFGRYCTTIFDYEIEEQELNQLMK